MSLREHREAQSPHPPFNSELGLEDEPEPWFPSGRRGRLGFIAVSFRKAREPEVETPRRQGATWAVTLTCLHPAALRAVARRSDRPSDQRDGGPLPGSRPRELASGRDRSALPDFLHTPPPDADTGCPASARWPPTTAARYCRRPGPGGLSDVTGHEAMTARRDSRRALRRLRARRAWPGPEAGCVGRFVAGWTGECAGSYLPPRRPAVGCQGRPQAVSAASLPLTAHCRSPTDSS